jgi:hypothetical protein
MRGEHYSRLRDLVGGIVYGPPKPLPAQFTGKRQLLEALLLDAIRTFHLLVHARKPGERQRFEEVEAWITSADTEYVFSFINVCTLLGLNAEAVRPASSPGRRPKTERLHESRRRLNPNSGLCNDEKNLRYCSSKMIRSSGPLSG